MSDSCWVRSGNRLIRVSVSVSENSKGTQTDNSGNGLRVKSLRMKDQGTNDMGESGEGPSGIIPSMYLSPHANQRKGNKSSGWIKINEFEDEAEIHTTSGSLKQSAYLIQRQPRRCCDYLAGIRLFTHSIMPSPST